MRFTSVAPYRLVFSGRLAHTMNAFGEHLSGGELDRAVLGAAQERGSQVLEYAVAARYPDEQRPVGSHVYYIEFGERPKDLKAFASTVDETLKRGNEDYTSHRADGYGLAAPEVEPVPRGTFYKWMEGRGKLGGQNKVPRVLKPELHESFLETLRT